MSLLLSPFGKIYGRIMTARNDLYESGRFRSESLGVKTISIGNITAGGTGKTPLVAKTAEILSDRGEKVCILTRGYGRRHAHKRVLVTDGIQILATAEESGDEPLELARKLLGKAVIIADADRLRAGRWAREKFGITAFVLDDGLQHRKVKRDIDIACIDAIDPFGGGKMLPEGMLREPLHGLSRAGIIVITRADLVEKIEDLKAELAGYAPKAKIFVSRNKISGIHELNEINSYTEVNSTKELKYGFAFCGLGNPGNFFEMLRRAGFGLTGKRAFSDHHTYSLNDIEKLNKTAKASGAESFLTTGKDAVKLSAARFDLPCFVVKIEPELEDEREFIRLLSV